MNTRPLVLVTRTAPDGKRLAERLTEAGFDAVCCSPVRLTGPANPDQVRARLDQLLPADRVILTSPEGVRQAIALVGAERLGECQVIVPGRGTARQAREAGLDLVVYPERGGTSEAMLGLPELSAPAGLSILILAAAGGRRLLEEVLTQRGACVHRVHVYRRQHQRLPEGLASRICDATLLSTLISSGGALEALNDQLPPQAWLAVARAPVVVPSDRVGEQARQLGCQQVHRADGADDESMIAALNQTTSTAHLR